MKHYVTPQGVTEQAQRVASDLALTGKYTFSLYGIPRGGVPAAYAVAAALATGPHYRIPTVVTHAPDADFFIDDIYDSGATERKWLEQFPGKGFAVLFDKRKAEFSDKWLVMPWEAKDEDPTSDESATDNIVRLLQYIGENPDREGLRETPARVLKAWKEWASGYDADPAAVLKTFEDGATDGMVIVHNIPIVSKCEHHLADIVGHAHVAYIPQGRIVGLSKIPRLVNVFARRLQVQERLTDQIADALEQHLGALGVGVLLRASHHCMSTRGVNIHGSATTTCALRGVLKDGTPRAEFLQLCAMAEK